ncbi:MAG TPA: preprotein translocase subunit SecA [Saprospiraceae bacterium]|mgnify:FL=1|jgi:preprotein translocase subunit SecA|nr:preprotein translocase subunit SecA [Saprospiraceae bacterium]HRN35017.1 preprotein translocase subunit SecA [Saprospiraceae bacterium]HRP84762.1 preprotein translocase subunit SecA [Saprospiraceae bacterium]
MLDFIKKLFGTKTEREVKAYMPIIDEINGYFESYKSLSSDELRNKTTEFRERIGNHLAGIDSDIKSLNDQARNTQNIREKESIFDQVDKMKKDRDKHLEDILRQILPEAFAVVKETARRLANNDELEVTATQHDMDLAATKPYVRVENGKAFWKNQWTAGGNEIKWDMVHYDVQLIGGMVLHDGKISEMATGEGKTLVASLPAYLNGLSGQGVHIVTVNDYLAKRDCQWNGPLYQFLLLTVDCIDNYRPNSAERRAAYLCDITYGTNNEFGFDYLRDNMVTSPDELVQRKHHYAMVDEVDSVLIDDARTPLIISGPIPQGSDEQEYIDLKPRVERLVDAQRKLATGFLVEAKKLISENISGNAEGEGGLALLRAYRALPKTRALIKYLSEEGVKVVLQKTENYYMQEQSKNMHIADEPLLFTIDEKNRDVELTEKGAEYLAQGMEDKDFFVLPDIGTEIHSLEHDSSLTAAQKAEEKEKLIQDYTAKSKRLHSINQLLKAYALFEKDVDYIIVEGEVKIVDEQTGRVMEGRRYSDGLHQALEAKENVKVGEQTQTYATVTLQNYFRMYHKLAGMTGTAETEASEFWQIYKLDVSVIPTNKPIVRKDMEDLVFKTAREKYNAVIEEISTLTKAGRPVLVGTTSVEISEMLSKMLRLRGIEHNVLNAKQHAREADIVAEAGHPGRVTIATNMAGRGTDIKISDQVKAAGGLAIIGTERHDSRRVDRQLRGRAGRQGDPGSSQFYVSLEDNLMRLFQSERIAKAMDRMGHKEGDVIQHSMITKSIERAQKRVEENNFGIRKRLLEYDDVMNIQREAIYKKRNNALFGDRLSVDLSAMFSSATEDVVLRGRQLHSFEEFRELSIRELGFDPADLGEGFTAMNEDQAIESFQVAFMKYYNTKNQRISEAILPIIKNIKEREGDRFKRIALPFSDGSAHPLPVSAGMNEAIESDGRSIASDIEKTITLSIIDDKWKEHLRNMDDLKDAVQAASFEQKDPLVIYKMEAFTLFENLVGKINHEVTAYLAKGNMAIAMEPEQVREARVQKTDFSKARMHKDNSEGYDDDPMREGPPKSTVEKPVTYIRSEKKVGRNDPCPCGSGKKYKACHGSHM